MYLTKVQSKFTSNIEGYLTDYHYDKLISEKRYSINDSLLSYRQINELNKDGVIEDKRENKKRWRKFSITEIIFLNAIKKLKELGLTNKQLAGFKDSFYKRKDFINAFYLASCGQNIILTIDVNGKAEYYDWLYFLISQKGKDTFCVTLNFYKIVHDFIDKKNDINLFNYTADISNIFNKISKKLGDYPDEIGLEEEEIKTLIEKIGKLSDILFDVWVEEKNNKNDKK